MATPAVPTGTPVPGPSPEPGGPRATDITQKPRRARRGAVIAVVDIVVLSVVFATFYLETRPRGPTDVLVNGANLLSNYTNAPAGKTLTNLFQYYIAWFNATGESPTVTSIQASAGSVVEFSMSIWDDLFAPPGVPPSGFPVNCSVNGILAVPPFAIASLEGQFKDGWNAQPFPLNFSGETEYSNTPALLTLNVTLPSQNGVYTPTFVLDITCEQYG